MSEHSELKKKKKRKAKVKVLKDGNVFIIPSATDFEDWLYVLSEVLWYSLEEMVWVHAELHKTFGDKPEAVLYSGEVKLSQALRQMGLEHRYDDALSKAAGTLVTDPVDPTVEEVGAYIQNIPVVSGAITLLQGVEKGGQVYAQIDSSVLTPSLAKAVIRQINASLPPGLNVKPAPRAAKEELVQRLLVSDLKLEKRRLRSPEVAVWKTIIESAPATVLKTDGSLGVDVNICRVEKADGDEWIRYMLGPVVIPKKVDTEGELVCESDTRDACHWWGRNSRVLAIKHVLLGGRVTSDDELVAVENYCLPTDWKVNEELTLPEGTWMLAATAHGQEMCEAVDRGELQAWSMGAYTVAEDLTGISV